jgi:hypothetical protein
VRVHAIVTLLRVQEVVRVYFTDHTYKSFMVGPEDTVRSLIMQVAKKVQVAPHGHYLLEMTGDGMHATLSMRANNVSCVLTFLGW